MNVEASKFRGIIVATNSCYDADGEVSPAALKRLVRFLIGKGVRGIYLGGSTGEGLLQSVEERKRMLEAAIEECKGEIAVIAHIGAINTRDSIELAKHAEQAGADAISAVPPFYYGHSQQAVKKHWTAIMDSARLPFIIYHIPSTTGFRLSASLLREIIENPQVIGVKASSGNTYELERFKEIGGPDFLVFNGSDEQYLAGRVMGADAGIGGTYGAMPELFVRLERLYAAGRLGEAQKLQTEINGIISDMLSIPIHFGVIEGAFLRLRGLDCGSVRPPMEEVSDGMRSQVAEIHDKIMRLVAENERTGGTTAE
ncbi:N-acetylneuraminate lyase [Gordoniibacillus kamchatkensis]|uniref:N-acetylneuraminate lyase n=1 Tax=Gordoniibacillus kamchatkensis TaxID=1590651 RepID=A0ABR5AH41_9BACL|nr:dihydrodipicolinate synthase family protein [Paenibacillus sp. VKM B-2647]KIL40344.1 N-acetylneuraminate lyase [Paenibacillus sp. VKM B-2647]